MLYLFGCYPMIAQLYFSILVKLFCLALCVKTLDFWNYPNSLNEKLCFYLVWVNVLFILLVRDKTTECG